MKKGRLTAQHWVLLGTFAILAIAAVEYVRAALTPPKLPPVGRYEVEFRRTGFAPDFELPDASGKLHRLKDLVKGKTVVTFVTDTRECRDILKYIGQLQKRLGKNAPPFVAVADFDPKREPGFRRETGLDQLFLYDGPGLETFRRWKALPAPRWFELGAELKLEDPGPSPGEDSYYHIAASAADMLGFRGPETTQGPRPVAPDPGGLSQKIPAVLDEGVTPPAGAPEQREESNR